MSTRTSAPALPSETHNSLRQLFPGAVHPNNRPNPTGVPLVIPALVHVWVLLDGVLQDHLSENPQDLYILQKELQDLVGEPLSIRIGSNGVIVAVRPGT